MPDKLTYLPPRTSTISTRQAPERRANSFKVAHNLLVSFQYAGAGAKYAFLTQRNFRLHTVIGTLALSLGLYLQLPAVELALIGVTISLVMALELVNTAIEAAVDLAIGTQYSELAKIAKDCAAAAVLITAIAAVLVAACLLLPPLLQVLV